jgi:hypothetical protein
MQAGHAAEKSRALRDMQRGSLSRKENYQMESTPDLISGGW